MDYGGREYLKPSATRFSYNIYLLLNTCHLCQIGFEMREVFHKKSMDSDWWTHGVGVGLPRLDARCHQTGLSLLCSAGQENTRCTERFVSQDKDRKISHQLHTSWAKQTGKMSLIYFQSNQSRIDKEKQSLKMPSPHPPFLLG